MSKKKTIIKNVSVGVIAQVLTLLLSFISRSFFINYIGIEILGISGTLTSIISSLSLVDLGIYSVVIYRLYDPIVNERYEECCEIVSVLRKFLNGIAIVLSFLFVIISPLLRYILKGVNIDRFVYIAYSLFCLNSVISYFLAYKRTFLYAVGKDSVAKAIDSLCNLCFTGIRIFIIIYTRNFLIFQTATIIQTIISNLIIHLYCKNHYKWLHSTKINKSILKQLFLDTRNVFASKIAGYVHGSTDNLVISIFLKTIMVGFYSNYILIESSLVTLFTSITNQITPFIGQEYALTKDKEVHGNIINHYTFIRFVIAGCFVIPFYCLANSFIIMCFGKQYILKYIPLFLSIDLYIHIVHSIFTDYETICGLFNQEKKISIIGACINIVSSIILVNIIGLTGVIIGTVISQFFYWFARGRLVLIKLFDFNSVYIKKYLFNTILYIIVLIFSIFIISRVLIFVKVNNSVLSFIIQGIICELAFIIIMSIFFGRTESYKYLFNLIRKVGKKNEK